MSYLGGRVAAGNHKHTPSLLVPTAVSPLADNWGRFLSEKVGNPNGDSIDKAFVLCKWLDLPWVEMIEAGGNAQGYSIRGHQHSWPPASVSKVVSLHEERKTLNN